MHGPGGDTKKRCIGKRNSHLLPRNRGFVVAAGTNFPVAKALNPTVFGGLLSGGLHAITGTPYCEIS